MSEITRTLRGFPTPPAIGCGPNSGGAFSQADDHHAAAGWGTAMSVVLVRLKRHELIDVTRVAFRMNHENGGYDRPRMYLPRRPPPPYRGHLGERDQARHLGVDQAAGDPGHVYGPHGLRAVVLGRPHPRKRRAPDRADAIRRRERQVHAGLLGMRPSPGSTGTSAAWTARPDHLRHVQPAGERGDLPASDLGPRARDEQPARLLEHVPRSQRPGDAGRARHRQGDGRSRQLRQDRLPDRDKGERGLE